MKEAERIYPRNDRIHHPLFIVQKVDTRMNIIVYPPVFIRLVGPVHHGSLIGPFENPLYNPHVRIRRCYS